MREPVVGQCIHGRLLARPCPECYPNSREIIPDIEAIIDLYSNPAGHDHRLAEPVLKLAQEITDMALSGHSYDVLKPKIIGYAKRLAELDRLRTELDTLRAENALLREVAQKAFVAMDNSPRLPSASMRDAYRALSRVFVAGATS